VKKNNPLILVVDDEPIFRDLLKDLLKKDYQVRTAKGGMEALELTLEEPLPNLILLDCLMPDIDGVAVCLQLKNNPRTADIPVLFLTVKNDIDDEVRGFEAGALDYIHKPISPPQLLARLRTHIELKATHEELTAQKKQLEQLLDERNKELEKTRSMALSFMENMVLSSDGESDRTTLYRDALKENIPPESSPDIQKLLDQTNRNEATSSASTTTDKEAVLVQLDRIIESSGFINAQRMRSLLKFIVHESLSGHTHALKAFTIAVEVFQRDERFDPQQDPLIRVQAGNLRKRLEQYYQDEGKNDPTIIEVPKGAYFALFSSRSNAIRDDSSNKVEDAS